MAIIYGTAGNDTIYGWAIGIGANASSPSSQDTLTVLNGGLGFYIGGGPDNGIFYGGVGNDTLYGGSSNDYLYADVRKVADGDSEVFSSYSGNNYLKGGDGDDTS